MVLTKQLTNGTRALVIRLILTAIISGLLSTAGWLYADARNNIRRDEVNAKLKTTKVELRQEIIALEERTCQRFDNLENRINTSLDRFNTSINKAIDRLDKRID